jgi:CRISPR-associated protein Cas2
MNFGGMRSMWIIAMFDLPVDTPRARRAYASFRKRLLQDGFTMMQYSVYIRHCANEDNAKVHYARIKAIVPADGEVRVIGITDLQFGRMQVFLGGRRKAPTAAPAQIEMF